MNEPSSVNGSSSCVKRQERLLTRKRVLVIDETGDRKDGHKTAHVGRHYLGSVGKINDGAVSVTSLWADSQVYSPLEVEPSTPESYFPKGRSDPAFRTKRQIALQLVQQAVDQEWLFRAVVADSFYGKDRGLRRGLQRLSVGYVMALKPSHSGRTLPGYAWFPQRGGQSSRVGKCLVIRQVESHHPSPSSFAAVVGARDCRWTLWT